MRARLAAARGSLIARSAASPSIYPANGLVALGVESVHHSMASCSAVLDETWGRRTHCKELMNQRIRIDVHGSAGLCLAVLSSLALLCGCGGGGGNGTPSAGGIASGGTPLTSASLSEALTVLGYREALVVRFDAPADPSSVRLSGTLAGEASGMWSKTTAENDTYTLTPTAGAWRGGSNRTISVTAAGKGGGNATVAAAYAVQFVVDPGATATNVIGQPDFTSAGPGPISAASLFTPVGGTVVAPDGKFFVADYGNHRVLAFNKLPTVPGASADLVLGQPDFTTSNNSLARDTHLYPISISIAGGKMAVADSVANRIVIYNTIPADSSAVPDVVVGQADFTHADNGCSATALSVVHGVQLTPDGKLIAADAGHNRVLIWNTVPTSNGQHADIVLGQSTFNTCVNNDDDQDGVQDSAPSARTLFTPWAIWSDGNRLLVTDYGNNRVLLWKSFPAANFARADVVLGQSALDKFMNNDDDQDGSTDASPSDRTFSAPGEVTVSGDQIAVADSSNHRVLVWNQFPTASFARADMVIGQDSFTANGSGTSASKLFFPFGAYFVEDKLIVADMPNNRLLVFTSK